MRTRLDDLEDRLSQIIELAVLIIPGNSRRDVLVRKLVDTLRHKVQETGGQEILPPDGFQIFLHPDSLATWNQNQGWSDWLINTLVDAAQEVGIRFPHRPDVQILPDENLARDDIRITPRFYTETLDETSAIRILPGEETGESVPALHAYLILNGEQIIPLTEAVINIGRREDNQIVLDDQHISRSHAQLRLVHNHYIVFDLGSTGGTFVNGERVSRWNLTPGDVISLAGIMLVYGEEEIHAHTAAAEGKPSDNDETCESTSPLKP